MRGVGSDIFCFCFCSGATDGMVLTICCLVLRGAGIRLGGRLGNVRYGGGLFLSLFSWGTVMIGGGAVEMLRVVVALSWTRKVVVGHASSRDTVAG